MVTKETHISQIFIAIHVEGQFKFFMDFPCFWNIADPPPPFPLEYIVLHA